MHCSCILDYAANLLVRYTVFKEMVRSMSPIACHLKGLDPSFEFCPSFTGIEERGLDERQHQFNIRSKRDVLVPPYGSRQANLVLIAYASSEGSGEPAQSRQNLRCSLIQAVSQEEPSDRKPDPWPL